MGCCLSLSQRVSCWRLKDGVLMSLSATPADLSSLMTAFMAVEASACALATLASWACTPTLKMATSGTTVTLPSPVTQMPVFCPALPPVAAGFNGAGPKLSQPLAASARTATTRPRTTHIIFFIFVTSSGGCCYILLRLNRRREIPALEIERQVDQADERRHLDQ